MVDTTTLEYLTTTGLIDTTTTGLIGTTTKELIDTTPTGLKEVTTPGRNVDAFFTTFFENSYEEVQNNDDEMNIETVTMDNLVVNQPLIPHPEPPMEVVSKEEMVQTNEMAMKVDISSYLKVNQVLKVSEMVQTNEVAMTVDIPQNQEVLVLAENITQEKVQTASTVNSYVQDISVSGENSVQNVTMEYQDITGKNYQKKFSVYQKAPVSFTFKNALVLVQYNGKATTNQITKFYKTVFPYYCTAPKVWMNNARRNLSEKNGYFKKTGEAATKIKGQRGPQGEFWTFSDKKEKLKQEMTKVWKESEQDIKNSTPYPDLVETLFKKVLALNTSGIDAQKKSKRQKQCLNYYQLAVLAMKDSEKDGMIISDVQKFCEKFLTYFKDETDKTWIKSLSSIIAKTTKHGMFVAKGKNGEKSYTLAPEKKESEYRNVLKFCQENEAKIKNKMCDPEMFVKICK